jgi:hypothetical protein
MPAVVAGGREFLGWTAAIVAIGLAVASGNLWALLPLAPLLLIIQIEDWPRWTQEPAARLLQAALYASLGVCLFIATDFVFGKAVSEQTYRTVETGILECREWLDYLTDLRFMLPAIVVAGGISWLAADRRVIAWFGRGVNLISTVSLSVYTLSLFTLFTAVQGEAKLHGVEARIGKYQIALDGQKKAVGQYLATAAVAAGIEAAPVQQRGAFADALLALRDIHEQSASNPAPPAAELRHAIASQTIIEALKQVLPDPSAASDGAAAAPAANAGDDATQTEQVERDIKIAQERMEVLNATLKEMVGALLGGVGMDAYSASALSDLIAACQQKYFDPVIAGWGANSVRLREAIAGVPVIDFASTGALALDAVARFFTPRDPELTRRVSELIDRAVQRGKTGAAAEAEWRDRIREIIESRMYPERRGR